MHPTFCAISREKHLQHKNYLNFYLYFDCTFVFNVHFCIHFQDEKFIQAKLMVNSIEEKWLK